MKQFKWLMYTYSLWHLAWSKYVWIKFCIEIVSIPTEDDNEDTPLILAIKHFTSFVNPMNLSEEEGTTNLDVVVTLIQFG